MQGRELKQLLQRDFGFDLDIAGGFGGAVDNAIYVFADTPDSATFTELLVLRGIGMGRGILWRCISSIINFV